MFSVNVADGNDHQIVLDTIYGLGEYIVLVKVTPDHFVIDKETLQIVDRNIVHQPIMLERKEDGGTVEKEVPADLADQQVLTDDQIKELTGYAKKIEQHYGCYMDMEFALDKNTNKLWIVQARPETVWSRRNKQHQSAEGAEAMGNATKAEVLLRGLPASPGFGAGKVHVIASTKDIDEFQQGEILVTVQTSPDWVPAMKKLPRS